MTQGYFYQTSLDTFRQGLFARSIALITIFLFVFVFYANPAAAAVADEVNKTEQQEAALDAAIATTPEKALSYRLGQLRDRLLLDLPHAIETREADQNWFESVYDSVFGEGPLTADELDDIRELQTQITQSYDEVIQTLQQERVTFEQEAADAGHPLSADVKQLVAQRHQATVSHIQSRYQLTQSRLAALLDEDSDQEAALEELQQSLKTEQFTPTHTPVTPDALPWGVPEEDVRAPLEKPEELLTYLDFNPLSHYPQYAQAGSDPELDAEIFRNAQNADVQAGLKPTLETESSDAIEALATTLNHNSVEIYTWVHNNIKFIPSYGSIQGAQHTLETKQGNAIDTASLLIALLKASDIPARYQYGVVELPAEKVMNWVGGAKTPEAAQAILGMGGVPVVGVVESGKIAKFKMEHVWVEAYVDYLPSRGQVEKAGDSWIPMDASFKQYEFTEGMNLQDTVPFNAEALANTIKTKAVINEQDGWVMNVPHADIEAQLTQFQNQLKAHIENQNPDATVGGLLGLQEIKVLSARPLAAGLPYNRLITSQTFYEVPDKLRHKFRYVLSTQNQGYAETELIRIEEPTAKLAGKSLSLSFKPASAADEAIITSRLPAPEADGSIDPNKLPQTLPGYLIKLNAEFNINGEAIRTALAGTMGSEMHEEMGLYSPKEGWSTGINHPVAGTYRAIGLNLQGANPEQAARLKQQLDQTKTKLESADEVQLATLTKHQLMGDLLYDTVFNYFAMNDLQDQMAAQSAGILNYRLPSYGTFSTNLKVQYLYGLPRQVEFSGLSMDIDKLKNQRVSKTNNKDEGIAFSQSIGARQSAMEHLVPEQMFSDETEKAEGISTVKALGIASAQGQKIWTISQQNLNTAMSQLMLSAEAENDIRNAVNAGKVVTAHEQRINFNGWVGEGYSVIDPKTGAGGYIISGGGNGSDIIIPIVGPDSWLSYIVEIAKKFKLVGKLFAKVVLNFLAIFGAIESAYEVYEDCPGASSIAGAIASVLLSILAFGVSMFFFFALGPAGWLLGLFLTILVDHLQELINGMMRFDCRSYK